jgi:hypothetical protein
MTYHILHLFLIVHNRGDRTSGLTVSTSKHFDKSSAQPVLSYVNVYKRVGDRVDNTHSTTIDTMQTQRDTNAVHATHQALHCSILKLKYVPVC